MGRQSKGVRDCAITSVQCQVQTVRGRLKHCGVGGGQGGAFRDLKQTETKVFTAIGIVISGYEAGKPAKRDRSCLGLLQAVVCLVVIFTLDFTLVLLRPHFWGDVIGPS